MTKKLLSLLLCVTMLFSMVVFTGCSEEDESDVEIDDSGTSSVKPMTLVLYSICEEGTTAEATALVQDALNEITEAKFNTHIVLRLFTEDEYYEQIETRIEEIEQQTELKEKLDAAATVAKKAAKSAGVTTSPPVTETETETEEETYVDEIGLSKTVYPEVSTDQLDIFLITDYDKYYDYFSRGVLLSMDEELSVNAKILKKYISSTLLGEMKIEGATYAIPNNHAIGNYTYMLINREYFDKYYYDIDDISSIASLSSYVSSVAENESCTAVLDCTADGISAPVYYLPGAGTLCGAYMSGKLPQGQAFAAKNIFSNKLYKSNAGELINWKSAGIMKTADSVEGQDFGVAFVEGNYSLREQYEDDYYVVTFKNPELNNDNAYSAIYAVGSYTKSLSRCMEVITLLTTNEEFRNIFQYGVQDVNYEIEQYTDELKIISSDYNMNPLYTGNMFKLWTSDILSDEDKALAEDNWADGKLQNADISVSPLCGYSLKDEPEDYEFTQEVTDADGNTSTVTYQPVKEIAAAMDELSAEYQTKLDNYKVGTYTSEFFTKKVTETDEEGNETVTEVPVTYEVTDITTYMDYLAAELAGEEAFIAATNTDNAYSPASQFSSWYSTNFAAAE